MLTAGGRAPDFRGLCGVVGAAELGTWGEKACLLLIVEIRGAPSSSGKALTVLGDQYKLGNFTPLLQANHNTKNRTNMVRTCRCP